MCTGPSKRDDARAGLTDLFDATVLSVQVGWRKPHPAIYRAALDQLGIFAADAVFVGDSYVALYVGPSLAGIRSGCPDAAVFPVAHTMANGSAFLRNANPLDQVKMGQVATYLADRDLVLPRLGAGLPGEVINGGDFAIRRVHRHEAVRGTW
jgi:hypothetical protein